MNGDGTRAGLAFTARDLDRDDPLNKHYVTGFVLDSESERCTLYGGLLQHNLFSSGLPYGFELWAPLRPRHQLDSCAEAPTQWAYLVLPMARLVEDFTAGLDGWAYSKYDHPNGHSYPAVTFTLHAGHQWGRGPHPVRLIEAGDAWEPAYFTDDLAGTYKYAMGTTTMAPSTALQYTDDITHRKPARKGPS